MIRRTAVAVSLSLALAACKTNGTPASTSTPAAGNSPAAAPAMTAAAVVTVAPAAAAPTKGAYEIKSGTIEMKNSMMDGMKTTLYFDDYGAKHATVTSMDMKMMGQSIKSEDVDITADGYMTKYDAIKKEGKKFKIASMAAPGGMPDIKNMTEDMKKGMKELPEKEIAGKKCKGMEMTAMGMKMKAWSWKGIPLYTETDMSGGKGKPIVMEATSVKEGDVPASRFAAPADVKIVETDMSGNPVGAK